MIEDGRIWYIGGWKIGEVCIILKFYLLGLVLIIIFSFFGNREIDGNILIVEMINCFMVKIWEISWFKFEDNGSFLINFIKFKKLKRYETYMVNICRVYLHRYWIHILIFLVVDRQQAWREKVWVSKQNRELFIVLEMIDKYGIGTIRFYCKQVKMTFVGLDRDYLGCILMRKDKLNHYIRMFCYY